MRMSQQQSQNADVKQLRRISLTSDSSNEVMNSSDATTDQRNRPNSANSSPTNSDHNDSDNYDSESGDGSSNANRKYLADGQYRSNSQQQRGTLRNIGSMQFSKKIRSSTPNCNRSNNNNYNNLNHDSSLLTTTGNRSVPNAVHQPVDRSENESGFVDASSQNLNNSSPERPPSGTGAERDDVKYICPICEVVSATPHEFTNHIRCHNYSSGDTENFTCRICSKVLSSASSLDRHVLVHTGERPFNCKYCHLTFTTNGNMHRHMRTHKQHLQQRSSNIGNAGSGGSGGGGNGGRSGSGGHGSGSTGNGGGESDESDGCFSTDSSSGSSTNNNRDNSNNNNNNNNYKRKNTDDDNGIVKRRMKTINNNIISESELEYAASSHKYCCPVCSRSDFTNMFALGTHMDREHPGIPAKCRQCEMVFKSHKSLNAHRCLQPRLNITQGFKDITFVDFSSEKFPLIAKSLCEQSIRTPITSQKFECSKCFRAFPCASAVEIHAKDCGESVSASAQDYSLRKRSLSESSEEENRRDEFFAHLDLRNKSAMSLASTMSSPQTSEKSDTAKADLEKIPSHAIYNNNNCYNESKDLADIQSILNVTSSSNSFLRNFESVVNTPSSECGLGRDEEEAQDAFTSEFRKMKLRGEFPCKLCTAVFPNLRALKGHNRVHLSAAGAGPYRCNMCPYTIHDKAALIRHMRTHNGDRPYECAVCNYAFTTKANCERHLRNRHAKTTRDEVKRAIIYHPSEDSSCEDPIKKLQMFSSPELDDDEQSMPKDRSTPVSHLKEMLQSSSPIKIQVKSLEKLMDSPQLPTKVEPEDDEAMDSKTPSSSCHGAIDLSMDVLDLSKKSKQEVEKAEVKQSPEPPAIEKAPNSWFLTQQQLFKESLAHMDPANYLQLSQFYRSLMFPSIQPFLFPNSFLPNNFSELNKFPPMLLNPMFPTPSAVLPDAQDPLPMGGGLKTTPQTLKPIDNTIPGNVIQNPLQVPIPPQLNAGRHPMGPNSSPIMAPVQNSGPVKMVIKNGVLMPKQKQRRYRTERPFTCEHCSARFTLRSNMERHVKQQHPQFWAQRQRTGHHIMRRSGSSAMSQVSPVAASVSSPNHNPGPNHFNSISDQVKYAILAQQLKARKDTDILQQALAQNKNLSKNHLSLPGDSHAQNPIGANVEDDDPKLVIDEDNADSDGAESQDESGDEMKPEDLSSPSNFAAKKTAATILEQAIKAAACKPPKRDLRDDSKEFCHKSSSQMMIDTESVGNYMQKASAFKEDSSDLVSVSKLVDNATNSLSFNNYFCSSDLGNPMEQSDEEGLVASGSASESNNSGTEDPQSNGSGIEEKRKSAYSLAPNRVSCNYCQRTFPWTSSLRRHILTHTGQKPFKCSHCPLLFTTKSNCDRHLLRKHGNVESAVSLYVPIEDVPDPVPLAPKVEDIIEDPQKSSSGASSTNQSTAVKLESLVSSADLPFKCHLCDNSFTERTQCLDHIKSMHLQEFALLLAKGAVDLDADYNQLHSTEDEERMGGEGRGKYPDYANRKVMCAFCMRRFWSTEDLRRHMRTHSGERPFQCEICLRKFTLKHSMLRHMKKHGGAHGNHQSGMMNSGSDMSEDEQPSSLVHRSPLISQKIQDVLNQAEVWRRNNSAPLSSNSGEQKENIAQQPRGMRAIKDGSSGNGGADDNSDLITDLLGISGQGILNKLLSSADEAAKLLGVDK